MKEVRAPEPSPADVAAEAERLADKGLEALGWRDAELERAARLTWKINRLKKETKTIIPAHVYQRAEILVGVADIVGDSYKLAKLCAESDAERIVFCGVRFMAETAKVLNPEKEVLLPAPEAGCSLSESISASQVRALKKKHPGAPVATYINTSAAVKAESDVIVTSANAPKILRRLYADHEKVVFIPDAMMGRNLAKELGKKIGSELIVWDGSCIVHDNFDATSVEFYRKMYPGVKILAHFECSPGLVSVVDYIGGTGDMMKYVAENKASSYMLITECGLGDLARTRFPEKTFVPMCRLCPYMKATDLSRILRAMERPAASQRVEVPAALRARAAAHREDVRARRGSGRVMTWSPWSPEAFARAKAQGKLVLAARGPLPPESLEAAAGEIARRFVPVLADPQTRPDAAARIGAGRAVVLGADGSRRGELSLSAADPGAALERLAAEAAGRTAQEGAASGPVWSGAVREKPLGTGPDAARLADVFTALPALADPSDEVLEALLYAASERSDAAARAALDRGLAAMLDSSWDPGRRAFRPDTGPSLTVHARRARLLWDAHALTGSARWRDAAAAATNHLLHVLREPGAGAFRAEPGAAVYPADGNALAALALLRAAAFGVPGASDAASLTLGFLQTRLYDPLLGLVHAQGGDGEAVHGLLGDAAWTALAFTEAFLAGGVKQHREFADGLLRFLFQELWERDGGGFLDRVPRADDPAILRETHMDPALNSIALEVCWRLHHLKGNANYRRWLDWGLRGAWPAAGSDPARLAALARVGDLAARGRADFELVGRHGEAKSEALLSALRRHYAPRTIISFVDPDDQDYIMAHKLEADAYPRLFGCGSDLRRLADAGEPERVGVVVAAVRAAEAA